MPDITPMDSVLSVPNVSKLLLAIRREVDHYDRGSKIPKSDRKDDEQKNDPAAIPDLEFIDRHVFGPLYPTPGAGLQALRP